MSHRILIADDEQAILDTLRAHLTDAGFEVAAARNWREALYAFRHEKPDLVILDVMMPEMNGWDVARLIRKDGQTPIFFLTARVDLSGASRGRLARADAGRGGAIAAGTVAGCAE